MSLIVCIALVFVLVMILLERDSAHIDTGICHWKTIEQDQAELERARKRYETKKRRERVERVTEAITERGDDYAA